MLVAYVLLKDSTLATEQLQDWLRKKVPEYMIPHVFMYLNAFPLTANGKLDRRSLPRPTPQYLEKQRTPVLPRTVIERQLTKIFADVLSLETIDIKDNLFDRGFHSLLVMRTIARIHETLQVDIPPPLFFEYWTIEGLAQYLQTTHAAVLASPSIVAPQGQYRSVNGSQDRYKSLAVAADLGVAQVVGDDQDDVRRRGG